MHRAFEPDSGAILEAAFLFARGWMRPCRFIEMSS